MVTKDTVLCPCFTAISLSLSLSDHLSLSLSLSSFFFSDVYDHCILQLADPDAPSTNPTHFVKDNMLEDHTYSSSESPPPVVSNHPPPSPPSAHRHYNQSSHLTTPLHSPAWPQLDAHYYAEPSATDTR